MTTFIIYDETGQIFSSPITGSYIHPQGELKYLETEIPEGQILKGIDITKVPNVPLLEDIPKTELEILKEQVENLTQANAELTNIIAMKNTNV